MTCPNCEAIISDKAEFCPNCGNNILPNDDKGEKKPTKKTKKKLNFKIIIAAGVLIIIVALVVLILSLFSGNKGEKIAKSLSDKLGRSVAMAEKNANIVLSSSSENTVLKNIVDYDYIIEDEKAVSIEGIHLPEWAVFVENDENDKIQKVTYYNFKVLERNWKGEKTKEIIDVSKIASGMTDKEVQKLVSVNPLAIIRSNDDTTAYLYKYYFVDETDKNEKAYYFTVNYDVNSTVKDVSSQENDYVSFIFK